MSRCSHGVSPTNSFRNMAAVTAPPQRPAAVNDVGDVGLDHVAVLFVDRQTPHLLARLLQRFAESLVEVFVVGENAGIHHAQRNHARASQRRRVDEVGAAQLARVVQAVGQHQAPFGVGVDDLD